MDNSEGEIRILIADDHPIFRKGLIKTIEDDGRYSVISETGNGSEALELIRKTNPDIAVLDIDMPGKSGIEILQQLYKEHSKVKTIILTMYKDEEYFNESMDHGVKGYILKDSAVVELLECIESIIAGKHYISPMISDYLIDRFEKIKLLKNEEPKLELLTKTERQVMRLLSENKTSREIADEMFISERTVENHRANICTKLGLKGYNALLLFAIEHKSIL
jgi:two-component system response regulator DegU